MAGRNYFCIGKDNTLRHCPGTGTNTCKIKEHMEVIYHEGIKPQLGLAVGC
jgi:hypothetical protein